MILGLTGSFGAGKGEVVKYLVEKKGFTHFSVREFITEEIKKRGMPVNRDSMIAVGNDLRTVHGPSMIVDVLYPKAEEKGTDAVIESLRAVAEVNRMHELGGLVVGVDADPMIRYERAVKRGSETDAVTFDKWQEQEAIESNQDDPTKQNIFGALKVSDAIIMNNGTLEELHQEIEVALQKLLHL